MMIEVMLEAVKDGAGGAVAEQVSLHTSGIVNTNTG